MVRKKKLALSNLPDDRPAYDALKPKEKLFHDAFFKNDLNATRAVEQAGCYTPKTKEGAYQIGHDVKTRPRVEAAIAETLALLNPNMDVVIAQKIGEMINTTLDNDVELTPKAKAELKIKLWEFQLKVFKLVGTWKNWNPAKRIEHRSTKSLEHTYSLDRFEEDKKNDADDN